jgi:hypothetical protein
MWTLWCFRIAAIYLVVGMSMGMYMGMQQDFTLAPVHAHVNLMGFVVLTLAGLIFLAVPALGRTRLASVFFWLYNLASPVALVALAFFLQGNHAAEPVLAVSETVVWIGGVAFAANIVLNLRTVEAEAGRLIAAAAR